MFTHLLTASDRDLCNHPEILVLLYLSPFSFVLEPSKAPDWLPAQIMKSPMVDKSFVLPRLLEDSEYSGL